jgi:anti-sigma factor ChrR (cupin superfamily)
MKCTEIQELAAAHAAGALSRADTARLEALMAADPDVAAEVAAYRHALTSAIAAGSAAPAGPSPGLRERILERIARTPQSRPASPTPASSPGHFVIPHDSDTWIQSRVPGFRIKPLSVQPTQGYRMRLLELAPGGRIPAHDHADSEELFIVSGDLVSEGRHLVAGDFVHFDGNTHHHELMSPGGCHAILVERTPLPAAALQTAATAP